MQAGRIRYYGIGLAEARRRHPFNAAYDTGEELFRRICDNRGVSCVCVLVNTSFSMNIDSFEQLTTRIGRLRLKRCGSTPVLTIFVVYAPTSNYHEEEAEAFNMDLERFYREDHTFFKVIIGDFNPKIGPRRKSEERHVGTNTDWNGTNRVSGFLSLSWQPRPCGEYHSEIDYIVLNRSYLTDVAVAPKIPHGIRQPPSSCEILFLREKRESR
uniref:Endonuclease/exonuclease/phosphatase domain-containing protein n=1 Tax=Angiostrongylus cantonensis TaxID=6313 RepID=A0A0K0DCI9_ANGCA